MSHAFQHILYIRIVEMEREIRFVLVNIVYYTNKQSVHGKPVKNTPEVSDGGLGVSEGDVKIDFGR